MDRNHYFNKFGWEAVTTLSLAVSAASIIGMLLTETTSAKLGATTLLISASFLGLSLYIRAGLQHKEANHE